PLPGTTWGARRAAEEGGWPGPSREAADGPRGHEETEQVPSATALAPAASPFALPESGPAQGGDGQDTGEYPRPAPGGESGAYQPQAGPGRSDTGAFPRPPAGGPGDTGGYPLPGHGQDAPGGQDRGDGPAGPGDTAENPLPEPAGATAAYDPYPYGGRAGGQDTTGQFARPGHQAGPEDTGEFFHPEADGPYVGTPSSGTYFPRGGPGVGGPGTGGQDADTGSFPMPQGPLGGDRPAVSGAVSALDAELDTLPAAGPGDGRTPIFDTIESDWFRTHGGSGPPLTARSQAPAYSGSGLVPAGTAEAPAASLGPDAATGAAATGAAAADGGGAALPEWRTSPNDDRWRRAEQLRAPAAGGVTASGLPRRVPRANLVEGAAQQQSSAGGPQVSRAPDDVRGRLMNLRRGIQQGRRAGSGPDGSHDRGIGPTYQQER
ncbi:histidine kinase, partial [Streptomyces sp. B1866]|nr:histidine kinase [Streptomyces sp. B1866]